MARRGASPRYVRPETIINGDYIRARFPEDRGVIAIHEGRVDEILEHGTVRRAVTREGAVLFAYDMRSDVGKSPRITLLEAADAPQPQLPGFD